MILTGSLINLLSGSASIQRIDGDPLYCNSTAMLISSNNFSYGVTDYPEQRLPPGARCEFKLSTKTSAYGLLTLDASVHESPMENEPNDLFGNNRAVSNLLYEEPRV